MIRNFTFKLFATGLYTDLKTRKQINKSEFSPSERTVRNILDYAKSYHVLPLSNCKRDIVIN